MRRMRLIIFGCLVLGLLQLSAPDDGHGHFASAADAPVVPTLERPTVDGGWRHGYPDAEVQVAFYYSYDCIQCAAVDAALRSPQISNTFFASGHAQLLLYPQSSSSDSGAGMLAGCARDQNIFWQVHASFFLHQEHWMTAEDPHAVLESIAAAARLGPCGFAQPAPLTPSNRLPLVLVNGTRVVWTGDPLRDLEATLNDVCQF